MYYKFNYINFYIKLFIHLIENYYILQNIYYQLIFYQNTYILFNVIYYQFYFKALKLYNYFKHQFILFFQYQNYFENF